MNARHQGCTLYPQMRPLALLFAAVVVASCSVGSVRPTGSPLPAAAATTAAPPPTPTPTPTPRILWPLRGTPAPDGDAIRRRPVVVKVGNDVASRPQSGLQQADVVIELEAEFGITRLAVVYHSQEAERVGPVRSGRWSDLQVMPILRGILAHVGAEPLTLERIRDAAARGEFVDVDEFTKGGAFDRVRDRPPPYNTFTSTRRLREAAKDTTKVDVPALRFGESSATGSPATTLSVPYTAPDMTATYEASGEGFTRTQGGRVTDVVPANVLVIKTDITDLHVVDDLGSRAHEVRLSGEGPAIVLSGGKRYDGTWSRGAKELLRLVDGAGNEILLRPGLTWIHIVPLTFEVG